MKRRNGSDMPVKVFMFFFLLSSCYLLVFLSSLSAFTQACRHLIPMSFFSFIHHTHCSSIHLSLQVVIPISSLKPPYPRNPYLSFVLLVATFYLIQVSHTRNPSPPSFHPGVSHRESFSAAIPSGCLTPEILLRRHSIQVSHTRNPSPPTFHPNASHLESYPPTFHLFLHPQTIFFRFQNHIFNKALLPLSFLASNFSHLLCFKKKMF